MRARLLVVVQVLVGLLALGLGVPLALADTTAVQNELFAEQLTDTIGLAALAERAIVEGGPDTAAALAAELRLYDEVYGVAVAVYDGQRDLVAASRRDLPELDDAASVRVAQAAAGRRSEPQGLQWPWDDRPMVLAEPVLVESEVRGVAVTVTPTGALHARQTVVWLVVAAAGVLALGAATAVAEPTVRWILRPVRRLDAGTGRVADAVLAGREPDRIDDGTGPAELRSMAASFDRMAATVGRAHAAQRRFVADASHQLRNPLTALRLRLANLDGVVPAAATDDHLAALAEAERLSVLLDGLLALARAERTVAVTEVDLDAAVDDRVTAWRPLVEHSGVVLARSGERGARIRAADGAVAVLLDAVLDNAAKYTPPGGRIDVVVRRGPPPRPAAPGEPPAAVPSTTSDATRDASAGTGPGTGSNPTSGTGSNPASGTGTGTGPVAGAGVELVVRDSGPGLAPDALAWATERFWRAPGQSNVEGSGLGLAIAARTVEACGGCLVLESPPGGGLHVVARFARA